jgi:hypothetical protein
MLDAFSYVKPIIALKTAISEYYFSKRGIQAIYARVTVT